MHNLKLKLGSILDRKDIPGSYLDRNNTDLNALKSISREGSSSVLSRFEPRFPYLAMLWYTRAECFLALTRESLGHQCFIKFEENKVSSIMIEVC